MNKDLMSKAQDELIDTLISVVQRHDAELKAVHKYIDGMIGLMPEEAKLDQANAEFRESVAAWMKATEAKLQIIAEKLDPKEAV